ncbi:hypothetical protein [Limnoglobus roseus]|uniref:Uncharacterized protein n=1 Tax=Limnoglobus roseus TaxID=2598579 RepID=A0A5C1AKM8_9BACT|nr:hypothetical protein [Limnoglobus roseus]QEL18753.1 hypothetical protein PX52LOC_05790 [Limnoglobus roseus]
MGIVLMDECVMERPAPVLPMQWRIYAFDKSGKSYRGQSVFNTQEECQQLIHDREVWLKEGGNRALDTLDGVLPSKAYHYAIPMPELL